MTIAGQSFMVARAGPRGVNYTPSAVSVTPASGSGASQTFSYVFSDPNGYTDFAAVQMLVHSVLSGAGGCWIYYSRAANRFWLANDAGTAWLGPVTGGTGGSLSNSQVARNGTSQDARPTGGTGGSLSNSQCTLSAAGSSGSGSGNTLTVTIALSITSRFCGAKTNYMCAEDPAGSLGGWVARGLWVVP
jgi:hypothetical protein